MSENQDLQIVVIGASAAGLRAAARARRRLPHANITVIDQDSYISYGACGMPYFVAGDIPTANKLRETPYGIVRDPEFFRTAKGIEVITETRVEKIDKAAKKVICNSVQTGETSEYSYDKLVLATGASPITVPSVPENSKRVTTFKNLQDAIDLRQSLQKGEISKVGIVGGGFIGCEMAEAFGAVWGADVVLIEAIPNILPNILDTEMASKVETYLKSEGVEVLTNCTLQEILELDDSVKIVTSQGEFEVDRAVIAVGVRPNIQLASDCGLNIGEKGGIIVDEEMKTSDPDIYAAGDCVEVKHMITGKATQLPLGSLANRQGRVVGSNLGGGNERFSTVIGSSAVKVFDMNVAATGLTEAEARDAGFDVGCTWGTFSDKPDYYPEVQNIHLKVVYDKSSQRLLGLQGYGMGDVVKRVDVFASLLKNEGCLKDILDMEFAYAPPYAPAIDPLYALACTARNDLLEGLHSVPPNFSPTERTIIDARQTPEVEADPWPEGNPINIPLVEIRERWEEIPKDKPVTIVCAKGIRSAESARILLDKGFPEVNYIGGGFFMKPSN